MKIAILCLCVLFVSCFTEPKKENTTEINSTKTVTYNNTINHEPVKTKKFVYVTLEVKKPILDVFEPKGYYNSIGFYQKPEPIYTLNYENEIFITDILEIPNYNEDEKYKTIDRVKKELYSKLSVSDDTFRANLWVNCKDEYKMKEFAKERSEIINTEIYTFDSYSEASINKQKE